MHSDHKFSRNVCMPWVGTTGTDDDPHRLCMQTAISQVIGDPSWPTPSLCPHMMYLTIRMPHATCGPAVMHKPVLSYLVQSVLGSHMILGAAITASCTFICCNQQCCMVASAVRCITRRQKLSNCSRHCQPESKDHHCNCCFQRSHFQ